MADQEKHDHMLQRTLELRRFPIGNAPMCIPVTCEDSFRSSTSPLIVQRPTQDSSMGTPLVSRDVPDKVSAPSQVKKGIKTYAIMPEEIGTSGFSDGRHAVKNEHLMTSGPLGQCDDPDCVDCPPACKNRMLFQRSLAPFDNKGGRWKKKLGSFLPYIPIMNPHAKDNKCIVFSWHFVTALTVARSVTDAIYLLHIILQFRMAYVDPESRVVGTGDIVDEPEKVATRYLRGAFLVDLILVLPLPQVMIWLVIPKYVGVSSANYAKNMLRHSFK